MSHRFDAFGMCNAIYDVQAEVGIPILAELGLHSGAMALVDQERQRYIRAHVSDRMVNAEAGGAGANTMIGLAQLGGRACFTSRIGEDELGERYRSSLARWGVQANLTYDSLDTGVSLILITPDAQRTMNTCLGASRSLTHTDVLLEDLGASKYLYITGYLWDTDGQKEAVLHAMRHANQAGVKVAFSLADPFCVDRHRSDFAQLLDAHVDVVLANEEEAKALTGQVDVREALLELARRGGHVAVVTLGRHGSLISDGKEVVEIPAVPVDAVDTTGAGDLFASGILYGLTHGLSLSGTGMLGAWMAGQVVAQYGSRLETFDRSAALRHAGITGTAAS
ncbi:MAG: adenosine kinase [Armatimonadaceae bacterium]|jgi:sugar/nucleoside kinase (ribokinase family)